MDPFGGPIFGVAKSSTFWQKIRRRDHLKLPSNNLQPWAFLSPRQSRWKHKIRPKFLRSAGSFIVVNMTKASCTSCSSGVKQRLREQLPCSCLHPLPAEIRFCSIQATNTGSAIELRAMKSWPPCAACNCAFAHDLPKKGQLRSPKNGSDFGAQKQGRKQQPAK